MTGRELIIYILQNNLENEDVFEDSFFKYFPTIESVAIKYNVGVATVRAWIDNNCLDAIECGNTTRIIPSSLEKFAKKKSKQEVGNV